MRKMRKYKEMEHYFYFDAATGIWNRFYFNSCDEEYRKGKEHYPVGALYFSLGGVKEINETYGFAKGDQFIVSFVALLVAEFGKNFCYRMDGNEFLVLLEHFEEENAKAEAEAFEDLLVSHEFSDVEFGYAWSESAASLEEVVLAAEKDMQLSTISGTERVYEF